MFGADGATWPEAMIFLGVLLTILFLIGLGLASFFEFRKTKLVAKQEEDLRQLVRRYEQLAENSLDAQQRVAADVSELRSRATSIEKILRTVDEG
jgi:Tfp pilus assembly protein PilO